MATHHKNEIAKSSRLHASLGDARLHADSGMPDKRALGLRGDHADTDFPDKDYTPSTLSSSSRSILEMPHLYFLNHIFN